VTRETIYGFIAAEKTTYPVRLLCRVLQVSTSAFYDWIHRGRPAISDTDLDDAYDC
jgi:putative transposase